MAKKQKTSQPNITKKTVLEDTVLINNEISPNKNLYIAILLLAPFIVYAFGFKNQFLEWDDNAYITNNPLILEPIKNFGLLMKSVIAGNYHPITMLSMALNIVLFGKGPMSFIIVNTLIHCFNTYLVYVFIGKLLSINTAEISPTKQFNIAFFTALFFGIHPMHVESVIWISERKDVLYTCFFLLSMIKYYDFTLNSKSKNLLWVFVFFVLSCLSKGMAVVLPLILILIDNWAGKDLFTISNFKNKVIFFAFSVFFGVLTINVQGNNNFFGLLNNPAGIDSLNDSYSFFETIKFACWGLSNYLFKLFVPINLHHYYPYPFLANVNNNEHYLGVFIALIVITITVMAYIRNKKALFFGLAFFFIGIILVIQVFTIGTAILAERYTYLSYIGLIFLVMFGYFNYFKISTKIPLIVAALMFSIASIFYIFKWENTLTLWENTYKKGENNFTVLINLADQYRLKGDYNNMVKVCNEALDMNLSSPKFARYLGNYYIINKEPQKALEYYNRALKTPNFDKNDEKPELLNIYYNLGVTYRNLGNLPLALSNLNLALQQSNMFIAQVPALKTKANTLVVNRQYSAAITELDLLISKGVASDSTYNDRAVAKFSTGDRNGALVDLKKAVQMNPNNMDAQNNLSKLNGSIK